MVMARAGIPGGTAQTLLRHTNLNTTAIYLHVSDPKRVEAIHRLNSFG